MKNLHKKQFRLSHSGFWLVCALLVCLRLALTSFQQAYTWVGGAPLDDELMFRAAQNITAGEWLGAYDYLTLSKAMFFPVWLALLHALHLPYLVAGAALWCGAALLAGFAFSPLWRKKRPEQGRVLTLVLFAALAFLPSSWAAYTLRVYRDNIFPALCLYFFAGMAGMALRAVFEKDKPLWPWLAAAGAGLACGYLDREDAELEEGLYFIQDIIGLTVKDADSGIVYGKITDVYQNGASDVYSIRREDGTELMFPCIDEVVLKTDIDAGEMIIRPLPGLFEDAVDGDGDGE